MYSNILLDMANLCVLGSDSNTKNVQKYDCVKCNYTCSHFGSWKRHLHTKKHIRHVVVPQVTVPVASVATVQKNVYTCKFCAKVYQSRNGLWVHNKKCFTKKAIFKCATCGKEYKSRKGLWGHKKKCDGSTGVISISTPPRHDHPVTGCCPTKHRGHPSKQRVAQVDYRWQADESAKHLQHDDKFQ